MIFSRQPLRWICRHLFWLMGLLTIVSGLQAHELQPAYLELREVSADTWSMIWKLPDRDDLKDKLWPELPSSFQLQGEPTETHRDQAKITRETLHVTAPPQGATIAIRGPAAPISDTLVRILYQDGFVQIERLTPDRLSMTLSQRPGRWSKVATFTRLGIDHILTGADHLLFILGLLIIVRSRGMLFKTITAFTLAHSLTLASATLGWAHAPGVPLNAAIALSILFLGPEMMRVHRGQTSLTIEHPWIVAFCFGLLHGFGFAAGLTSLGLPSAEIPPALLFFNVGVEIGQVAFVALVLLMVRSFRTLEIRWPRWAELMPIYLVGTLGAFWTIQRTLIWFESLS